MPPGKGLEGEGEKEPRKRGRRRERGWRDGGGERGPVKDPGKLGEEGYPR